MCTTFAYLYILKYVAEYILEFNILVWWMYSSYIYVHLLKVHILVHWNAEGIEEKFSWVNSVVDGAEPLGWTKPRIYGSSIITKMFV